MSPLAFAVVLFFRCMAVILGILGACVAAGYLAALLTKGLS